MTVPQSMMLAEVMKTGRLVVAILSLISGGTWAARGFVDGYVAALDANTHAIKSAVEGLSELRTDVTDLRTNLTSFKSDVAKEIGQLQGAQQEKDRAQRRLEAVPMPQTLAPG